MTLILARMPAPPTDDAEHRAYHPLAARLAFVESVREEFDLAGTLTPELIDAVAYRSGRSRRHAGRMVLEWMEHEGGLAGDTRKVSDDFLREVIERKGNIAAAIRDVYGEDQFKHIKSRIYRALDEDDLGLKLALKKGAAALEAYLEIGVFVPTHRNELWLMDETKLPFICRGPKGMVLKDIRLTSIIEVYGRLVLNAQMTVGAADAAITACVIARAIVGGTWEGIDYGGSPDGLGLDNALANKAEAVKKVLRTGGSDPRYARPYTPPDKAMKERWYSTLKRKYLSAIPGATDGPTHYVWVRTGEVDERGRPKRERVERPVNQPLDPAQLLSLEELADAVYAGIHDYNLNHVHSETGMTPIERFGSDRTLLRRPGVAAFWPYAIATGTKERYIGERRGIHVDSEWRKGELPLKGRDLTARVLAGMEPRYLVGTATGSFLDEVTRTADETPDQKADRRARNRARMDRIRTVTKLAHENSVARAAGTPGTRAYTSERREAELEAAASPDLGDISAALAVPERLEGAA